MSFINISMIRTGKNAVRKLIFTQFSHLHYKGISCSVLEHRFCIQRLRTFRVVVVQVRNINRDSCDGLELL